MPEHIVVLNMVLTAYGAHPPTNTAEEAEEKKLRSTLRESIRRVEYTVYPVRIL